MKIKDAIRSSLSQADMVVDSYLKDLTDDELMVRPIPGTNHIAWQVGHLIGSERWLVDKAVPGRMEPLPEGFAAKHSKETAGSDNRADFLTKDEYLKLAKKVRANALAVLDSLSDEDLDKPVSNLPPMVKNVGDLFLFLGCHWLMHAGQWAIIRRKVGRAPLF